MFVTCSIQSLKFCRSHHYVQRGLRLLQLLRLLHLLRLLCLLHLLRLLCLLHPLPALATLVTLATLSSIATRILCQDDGIIKSHEDFLNQTWKFCFLQNRDQRTVNCFHQAPNNYRVFIFPSCLSIFFRPYLLYVKGVEKRNQKT